jgi:hypothetical protein
MHKISSVSGTAITKQNFSSSAKGGVFEKGNTLLSCGHFNGLAYQEGKDNCV